MIPIIPEEERFAAAFPRTRGDDPEGREILMAQCVFSPHPRG